MEPTQRKDLSITDNYVFGEIMEKPEFCIPLIEAILDVRVDHVEVHHSEHSVLPRLTGRGVRLDVYLRDREGVAYDVEMQNGDQDGFERRLGYYRSVLDVDAQERGTEYSDMRDIVVIFLTTFDPFGEMRKRYDCETIIRQTGARLADGHASSSSTPRVSMRRTIRRSMRSCTTWKMLRYRRMSTRAGSTPRYSV